MSAMTCRPVNRYAVQAKLRPAFSAVFAYATPGIMMVHYAVADLGNGHIHTCAHLGNNTAGLMASNDRSIQIAKP